MECFESVVKVVGQSDSPNGWEEQKGSGKVEKLLGLLGEEKRKYWGRGY